MSFLIKRSLTGLRSHSMPYGIGASTSAYGILLRKCGHGPVVKKGFWEEQLIERLLLKLDGLKARSSSVVSFLAFRRRRSWSFQVTTPVSPAPVRCRMVLSFIYLASASVADIHAGTSGFLAGAVLISGGVIALTLLSTHAHRTDAA